MNSVCRIGTCGICGGPVSIPAIWFGVVPPDASCERCGAVPKNQYGPVLPMESRRQTETKTKTAADSFIVRKMEVNG